MTSLSLFREKTTFYKISASSLRRLDDRTRYLRSNRAILDLSYLDTKVVVRGNSIFNTLRAVAFLLNQAAKDPLSMNKAIEVDWEGYWWNTISAYDSEWNPDAWISIHVDGETVYSSIDSPIINDIEREARGADLTEDMVRQAIRPLADPGEDLFVQHESQSAVLFSFATTSVRATVLERAGGRTKSFSATMTYKDGLTALLGTRVKFVADVSEALAFRDLLDGTTAVSTASMPAEQVESARERRMACLQAITDFELTTNVVYRPDRPVYA